MKIWKALAVVFTIGLLIYFLNMFISQQNGLDKKSQELKDLKAKYEQVQKDIKGLKDENARITSDEYIEKIAREKYGMVKKGETIYVDSEKSTN